jgi:hypothetical protein
VPHEFGPMFNKVYLPLFIYLFFSSIFFLRLFSHLTEEKMNEIFFLKGDTRENPKEENLS